MRRSSVVVVAVLVATAAAGAYVYWLGTQNRVPAGLARVNGRIEVERVDITSKYAGRLAEVMVDEGVNVS